MAIKSSYHFDFCENLVIGGITVAHDIEVAGDAEFAFNPGSQPYFSPSFGNWLPGDDAEIEITSISLDESLSYAERKAGKKPRSVALPHTDPLYQRIASYLTQERTAELASAAQERDAA